MKTIIDIIQNTLAVVAVFLLTCAIATILFVMHWAHGVVLFMHQIGAAQFVEALPLNDPSAANWIMWGVALFTSLSIIAVLIKMVEVVRNSVWTVLACGMMMVVVAFPVYHSYTMSGFNTTVEDVKNAATSAIEKETPEFHIEL